VPHPETVCQHRSPCAGQRPASAVPARGAGRPGLPRACLRTPSRPGEHGAVRPGSSRVIAGNVLSDARNLPLVAELHARQLLACPKPACGYRTPRQAASGVPETCLWLPNSTPGSFLACPKTCLWLPSCTPGSFWRARNLPVVAELHARQLLGVPETCLWLPNSTPGSCQSGERQYVQNHQVSC